MEHATLNDIKQSFINALSLKSIRYEIHETLDTITVRLHVEDTGLYRIYENLSVIVTPRAVHITLLCSNLYELNKLYAFNPEIGYALFKCAHEVNLVKFEILGNDTILNIILLPFTKEDSDKNIEIALNQLLYGLDKLKNLKRSYMISMKELQLKKNT